MRSKESPDYFRNFYARRILRIYPLYFSLLICSLAIAFATPSLPVSQTILNSEWLPFVLLIQNVALSSLPGPLVPTWSLAIEEHFYLFWAPIIRFVKTAWLIPMLGIVIVSSPLARYSLGERILGTNTILNLDALAFGALLALLFREERRHLWTYLASLLTMIGVLGIALCRFQETPLLPTWLACLFSGVVVFTLLSTNTISLYSRFLRTPWLMYLGTISYGLYLLHGWASIFVGAIGIDLLFGHLGVWGDLMIVAARVSISVVFATISWYLLEEPLLRLKKHFGGAIGGPEGIKALPEPGRPGTKRMKGRY